MLFVGINPGIRSATVGHHFAGYSNRFWRLMHESGLLPRPLAWAEDHRLPEWGYGITNLIQRPTPGIANLRPDEYAPGRRVLIAKVRRFRHQVVALVGLTLHRALFPSARRRAGAPGKRARRLRPGPCAERLAEAQVFLLPNPSGRNASLSYREMLAAFRSLRAHLSPMARPDRAATAGRGRSSAEAVLFDFDGVLVDSEEYHWRACRAVLAPLGIRLPRALYENRYLAFDDRTALRLILRDARLPGAPRKRGAVLSVDDLVRRKRRLFRRLCGARLSIRPRTRGLIRDLARRVPLAIVSGASRPEILRVLRRGRLEGAFRTIVAAEDVRRCKPHPEGYRLALRRLGHRGGDRCVAIEDSPGGIRAARAAGLRVIAVATTYPAGVLRRAGAGRVAGVLHDLGLEEVLGGREGRSRGSVTSPRAR